MVLPYSSLVTDGFKVDVFGDGYHVRTAKEVWKRSQKYQLECWRPERQLKREVVGEKDGIVYRAFPSWRPSLGKLTSFAYKKVVDTYAPLRWALWREYSIPLLMALREECLKGDVMLYVMHIPFDLSYMICLLCGNVPIIGQHIGGKPFGYDLISFLMHLPVSLIEKQAMSKVDVMMFGTDWHYELLKKSYSHVKKMLYPSPQCVDFDLFKPTDKVEARELVGIDKDKKVVIHVGRFDDAKGFGTILNVLPILRQKYDVEFIAIGGTKTDILYQRAIDSGARVFEFLPQEELVKYYNASDVYLFPKFYDSESVEDAEKYMGTGVAPVEALACNVPIIGTNIKRFFGTPETRNIIGEVPQDEEDLVRCVERVFEHPEKHMGCREVAEKYYSWNPIVARIVDTFDELAVQYYKP